MKPKMAALPRTYLLILLLTGCMQEVEESIVCGIYGNPGDFWEKGYKLNELGVNAVFVHSGSIDSAMIARARKEGAKVYAEFATLNGKGYVEKHPEAWAIGADGKRVESASWFMGVCPTEPGFRKYRFEQLRALMNKFELDGIWMDYVHWHAQFEEPDPILPETCFCSHCLESFQNASGILIPVNNDSGQAAWIIKNHDQDWRNWRCSVIAGWARDIKSIVKEENPDALLGLYHCPWNDEEFQGARRRILGLDYDSLRNIIDVFSPMVYHGRMGKEPEWVLENINWFTSRLNITAGEYPKVWPIVQAYDDPAPISPEEFASVMNAGLTSPCSGIMMFTARSVAENDGKVDTMKEIYQVRRKQ